MNKAGFFLTLIFICFFSSCQAQVPEQVQRAFEIKYPNENDPDWAIDKNGNFETHFKKEGKYYRADFSPDGKWIETERSIKKKELPELVRRKIKSHYDDLKIVEIEETRHHAKGLFYDVEFIIDGKKQDVEFNVVGEILN